MAIVQTSFSVIGSLGSTRSRSSMGGGGALRPSGTAKGVALGLSRRPALPILLGIGAALGPLILAFVTFLQGPIWSIRLVWVLLALAVPRAGESRCQRVPGTRRRFPGPRAHRLSGDDGAG